MDLQDDAKILSSSTLNIYLHLIDRMIWNSALVWLESVTEQSVTCCVVEEESEVVSEVEENWDSSSLWLSTRPARATGFNHSDCELQTLTKIFINIINFLTPDKVKYFSKA